MPAQYALLTVSGPDRPGIVAGIAEVLFAAACNLEDSSMTQLRGEFAILLIVRFPADGRLEDLEGRLRQVTGELGLTFALRGLTEGEVRSPERKGLTPCLITVFGADHPGIVASVTRCLADHQVNITDLSTQVIGEKEKPVYAMLIEADCPMALDELRDALESRAKELACDISIKEIEEYAL
ncbi:MAG: ACT domain-containing protein [Nitrospirota bacterium]|jgi:glycine cleavage system transcriptional repressor